MKGLTRYLSVIVLLALCVASPAAAEPSPWTKDTKVTLHNGEMLISCDGDKYLSRLILDGKEVYRAETPSISFVDAFAINGTDVVAFAVYTGGNRCPHEYGFFTVGQDKKFARTELFGMCAQEAKAKRRGDTVELRLSYEDRKPEKYIWDKGVVTMNGKVVK